MLDMNACVNKYHTMQIVVAVMLVMNACVNKYHTMSKHLLIDMIGIKLVYS